MRPRFDINNRYQPATTSRNWWYEEGPYKGPETYALHGYFKFEYRNTNDETISNDQNTNAGNITIIP
jgi:hypothetical protein